MQLISHQLVKSIMELLWEDVIKLLIALGIGAVIGSEREYRNKTAGFRTITLICFASSLFTILSIKIGISSPDRIAANIVTGIGFLGAGSIFKEENRVTGLTTAATIWVSAALGMCVGAGHKLLALVALVFIMTILLILARLERLIDNANEVRNYRITYRNHEAMPNKYNAIFKSHQLKSEKGKFLRRDDLLIGSWVLIGKHKSHEALANELLNDPNITDLEF